MEGAHVQCVNNHYAKFEYKEMKTVGYTDYTNQDTPLAFGIDKMSKFNSPKKLFIKCSQSSRCTCSMYEQSLCSLNIKE